MAAGVFASLQEVWAGIGGSVPSRLWGNVIPPGEIRTSPNACVKDDGTRPRYERGRLTYEVQQFTVSVYAAGTATVDALTAVEALAAAVKAALTVSCLEVDDAREVVLFRGRSRTYDARRAAENGQPIFGCDIPYGATVRYF